MSIFLEIILHLIDNNRVFTFCLFFFFFAPQDVLLSQNHHYEAKDLNTRETYEAWITASTRIGEGQSTPVIKLTPSSTIPAAVISFGQTLSVAWRVDVKLACLYVGTPKPQVDWKVLDSR